MSNRQTKAVLGVAVVVGWALVACTGGVGVPTDIGQAYGDDPGSFGTADKPGVDNQDPARTGGSGSGTATEGDPGKGNGNGNGKGNGDCPPCDGNVTCQLTVGGQTAKATLPLTTKNGACVSPSSGGDIVLACGGQITQNGTAVGTWKDCSPATSSGSSGGNTTTPTPPPTDTTVADAGTKG